MYRRVAYRSLFWLCVCLECGYCVECTGLLVVVWIWLILLRIVSIDDAFKQHPFTNRFPFFSLDVSFAFTHTLWLSVSLVNRVCRSLDYKLTSDQTRQWRLSQNTPTEKKTIRNKWFTSPAAFSLSLLFSSSWLQYNKYCVCVKQKRSESFMCAVWVDGMNWCWFSECQRKIGFLLQQWTRFYYRCVWKYALVAVVACIFNAQMLHFLSINVVQLFLFFAYCWVDSVWALVANTRKSDEKWLRSDTLKTK